MKQNDICWNLQNFIFWKDKINYNKIIMSKKNNLIMGGGGKDFFSFFPDSQYVFIMFLLSSQWVPIRFSLCSPSSQCVPQHVLNNTSILSHMLYQMLLSSFHL
jgi:hypothetical protein